MGPPLTRPGAPPEPGVIPFRHQYPTVWGLNYQLSFNLERPIWDQERTSRVETALYSQ